MRAALTRCNAKLGAKTQRVDELMAEVEIYRSRLTEFNEDMELLVSTREKDKRQSIEALQKVIESLEIANRELLAGLEEKKTELLNEQVG